MAKIHSLKIKNYRGIENFEQVFGETNFICLIGRGDSGKTTILHAINAVLAPNWNYSFNDTDFFNGEINHQIEIEASLYDLPVELITDSKYGLHKRLLNSASIIVDDLKLEDSENNKDILTIKLIVKKDLEPKWFVTNNRENQEDVEIRSSDRAKLNVFLVSDFIDRHFSWSKGNPLYSLLKLENIENVTDEIIIKAYREAKDSIDQISFTSFNEVLKKIRDAASSFGLSIENSTSSIDFNNTFIREGNISLYEDNVPFRMKGKGTKRLLSIAIQLELAKHGGIVLIDEIEQGLEPDRAKFLSKKLKDNNKGQVFITTHSSNILVELNAKDIFLMSKNKSPLFTFNEDFKGTIRKNPEVFFSKRIIVCEGATEIGICRALNEYLITNGKNSFAYLGIAMADGTGSNFIEYSKKFKDAGLDVCVFCDSDDEGINNKKQALRDKQILIIDCDDTYAIEQQLFNDLPWDEVIQLIKYAIDEKTEQGILATTGKESISDLITNDSLEIRNLLGEKAKGYKENTKKIEGWYKRIDHGEFIGKLWFESLNRLEGKKLKSQYDELVKWISE